MQAMGQAVDDTAYRALFEANPHPMWVFDRATLRFLAVNDAALRQYGYSRDEFLRLGILDIRPAEDAGPVRDSIESGLSTAQVWRHRRRDGSTLLAEVTAHNIEFAGVDARLALALDVTVREGNAALLKSANDTLEAVLQAAPAGVIVVRSNGGIDRQNEEARRLLGERSLEPLGELLAMALAGGEASGVEIDLGNGQWVDAAARPVALGLGSDGAIVTLTDATERRAAHEKIAAALRASDEELDSFCFSVSHDLRGPLRAVDGFAQVVLTDGNANLSDDNRDALERVRRAGRRMSELIDGLLALSRLSRAPFNPIWVDLTKLAGRTADDIARMYPDRHFDFAIAPGAQAYGDPALLTGLIERLLSNAAKFTAHQETARIEFLIEEDGWAVRDNGVGFDMAYSSRLFKPFERLHPLTDFPGNGLGLAVAYRIVRRHGGTIRAIAAPDEGATIRFLLPSPEIP